jgi:hypothetical protein
MTTLNIPLFVTFSSIEQQQHRLGFIHHHRHLVINQSIEQQQHRVIIMD